MSKYCLRLILALTVIFAISNAMVTAESSEYEIRTPAEFIEIITRSEIVYTISTEDRVEWSNLARIPDEPAMVHPYARIETTEDGDAALVIDESKQEVQVLFVKAVEKLERNDFKGAIGIYEQALELDPDYFKTWTNLGHTCYLSGDFDRAQQCLLKAVQLNKYGYQEHLFLGEVYRVRGRKEKALDEITRAYMLNKNNPLVQMCLERILEKCNLQIRPGRFSFPFRIIRISPAECKISYEGKAGLDWMPMANCLACWQMEPAFRKLLEDEERGVNALLNMYREAILNQVVVTDQKISDRIDISSKERLLHDAAMDHFLDAMLYWEILAGEYPTLILMLPEEEQEDIVEYIEKYVYESRPLPEQ